MLLYVLIDHMLLHNPTRKDTFNGTFKVHIEGQLVTTNEHSRNMIGYNTKAKEKHFQLLLTILHRTIFKNQKSSFLRFITTKVAVMS